MNGAVYIAAAFAVLVFAVNLVEFLCLVVPLCPECHKGTYGVHGSRGKMLNTSLKENGQMAFERKYPDLDFLKIFGRNYL